MQPIDRSVLSRVMIEADYIGEWDADNGVKPCTFKRIRRHTTAEPHIGEVHGENILTSGLLKRSHVSSSDSDEGSLTSKRQTRSRKGMLVSAAKNDLDQYELLSPNRSDSDHVLLSSKLHDLKKRKANPRTREDFLGSDRILKEDKKELRYLFS